MKKVITLKFVWNVLRKSKIIGMNDGRNIGHHACNMFLKYIGNNGSMGLTNGETYKVDVISKDHFIWVQWGFCKVCPYDSPENFAKNWAKP